MLLYYFFEFGSPFFTKPVEMTFILDDHKKLRTNGTGMNSTDLTIAIIWNSTKRTKLYLGFRGTFPYRSYALMEL